MTTMKPQTFTYVLIGVLAVLLVLGGVGYYFGIRYMQTESARLAASNAELEAAEARLSALARAKRTYDREVTPNATIIEAALPRQKSQSEILAQLQRIAGSNGLTISSVSFPSPVGLPSGTSQTVKSGTVLALPITLQIKGSYGQLQNFLRGVENLNRFTNVTSLNITRPDPKQPIQYAITLNAYIMP